MYARTQNLSSLTIVDLDGNDVEEILPETFANLPRLIYLRLSRNRVKRVGRGGFSNLVSLDGLDLFMVFLVVSLSPRIPILP